MFCKSFNYRFFSRIFFLHLIVILFQFNFIYTNPIDYFSYQSRTYFQDAGKGWDLLSTFGPIVNFNSGREKSNYLTTKMSLNIRKDSYSINGFSYFRFKKSFYGYFNPGISKNSKDLDQLCISNFNLINNYKDFSGFGFVNDWVILQVGRGVENWGAGNNVQLALSNNSSPYDYLLLGSDYGNLRVRYIHGFLERVDSSINRYITARGLEWTNKKSFVLGFSETVIYSGENRPMDISYFNPISSHLEIELNDRLNIIGNTNSNAVWQLHLDFLIKKRLRISANYLIDEFVFDPDIEIGKEHGRAFSLKFAYTPMLNKNKLLTFHSSIIYVGTPTFRHITGTNNFIQNGRPIGWNGGSDSYAYYTGVNYLRNNLLLSFLAGLSKSGSESVSKRSYDPYKDYLKGEFPSGKVKTKFYFETLATYMLKKNYSLTGLFYLSDGKNMFNLNLNIPIKT